MAGNQTKNRIHYWALIVKDNKSLTIKYDETFVERKQNDGADYLVTYTSNDEENRDPGRTGKRKLLFTINRESFNGLNLNPAILKVNVSSLKINNVDFKKNMKCILKTGDVLSHPYFGKFTFIDVRELNLSNYSSEVLSSYWIGNVLGKGLNGVVRVAHDLESRKKFAIKRLKTNMNEIDIIRRLKHPNLLRYEKSFITDEGMFLLTEFMNIGTLKDTIFKCPVDLELETEVKFAMFDVAQGLKHLHGLNIAHLDIKLGNVLAHQLKAEIIYKICDFGLSMFDKNIGIESTGGTPGYMPNEAFIKPKVSYSGKMRDMWSIGVLMFICFFKRFPISKLETFECNFLSRPRLSRKEEKSVSDAAKLLFNQLLVHEPSERLTVEEMLQHDWFNDFKVKRRSARLRRIREFASGDVNTVDEASVKRVNLR